MLSVITQGILNKTAQVYIQKAQKHHDIRLAAQTILDGISINISKAIEDGHIDHLEYQKIVQEKTTLFSYKKSNSYQGKKEDKEYNTRTTRRNLKTR